MSALFPVRVTGRRELADGIVGLSLTGRDGPLPAWKPGSHVDVVLPSRTVRQYSLCGPLNAEHYEIAVLRESAGRGGSAEVHDDVRVGQELVISVPRNRFPLEQAASYVFVAGGIGITPILPMIEALSSRDVRWRLVFGGRTRSSMAFLDDLDLWDDQVLLVPQDECGLIDLAGELGPEEGAAVYTCGPPPLIEAVRRQVQGWTSGSLHFEEFSPQPVVQVTASEADGTSPGTAFEIQLGADGPVLDVPAGRSILEVVLDSGADVLFSCEEGTCGSCETLVLAGEVDHRDGLLTDDERANGAMLLCVSRAACPRLVLDIAAS
ncbi:MAG: PDR/VanB family oxidoreductase [Nocardioides sp.]|uniref:PDR/VanB family oxidoreductase n=1 Tax=Nocardioides sp. TaxID=35761 RepID=UPI003265A906